jgi:glucokinase
MLFLTVGTGIGAAVVLDGHIYRGPTGMGAELGHMIVDPLGPRCGCGLHGCLEAVASGTALSRMGREAAAADPDGLIAKLGRAEGAVTGHTVTAAAEKGDAAAEDIFRRLGRWLGIGIASLATIFELEAVVIGGGVIRTGDLLLDPTRAAAREYAYAPQARGVPPVFPATFGSDAGMIGAALLALEHGDHHPAVGGRS